jgi:hypothetical protein
LPALPSSPPDPRLAIEVLRLTLFSTSRSLPARQVVRLAGLFFFRAIGSRWEFAHVEE